MRTNLMPQFGMSSLRPFLVFAIANLFVANAAAEPIFTFHRSLGRLVDRSPVFAGSIEYWSEDFEGSEFDGLSYANQLSILGDILQSGWIDCYADCGRPDLEGVVDNVVLNEIHVGDSGHGIRPIFVVGDFRDPREIFSGVVHSVDR